MTSPPLSTDSSPELIQSSLPEERTSGTTAVHRFAAHGPLLSARGSSGVQLAARDLRRIAVWELSGPMERLVADGTRDDVPSAEAKPIWRFDPGGSPPQNGYHDASQCTRRMRVYHVGAFPGQERDQIVALDEGQPGGLGVPRYGPGDRVYAEFNQQSGRWEIIGPAEDLWRFELKTPLAPNGNPDVPSTADAYLVVYDANQGRYVKTDVHLQVADFLDTWDADPGCRGYAKRMADSHGSVGWEVIGMAESTSTSSG
jgi:hypothetical protein